MSVLRRRHFKLKSLKRQYFFLMSEVTDIPLLIRKYCIRKKEKEKGKSQTGH